MLFLFVSAETRVINKEESYNLGRDNYVTIMCGN